MRIKSIATAVLLTLTIALGFAQTKEDALKDAQMAAEGTLSEDFDTVLKYTLPEIIEVMGGKENAKNTIVQTYDTMKSQGFKIEKAEILEVSEIVKEQGQSRCLVKSYNVMVMSGQRLKSTSHLLGIYDDNAKHWKFIEAKQLKNPGLTSQILPDFKTEMEIPEDEVDMEPIKN